MADAAPAPIDDFKAVVYLFLQGGADSWSTLVPRSGCASGLDAQYDAVRGDVAVARAESFEIAATDQPCDTFGVHPAMPGVADAYAAGARPASDATFGRAALGRDFRPRRSRRLV